MKKRGFRVLLVGNSPKWFENLSLGYLAASLEERGFDVDVHALNSALDVSETAAYVEKTSPDLLGLSMPDATAVILCATLGEMLDSRGAWKGHITCGGGFATLSRSWLLERYAWLDSVVRLRGEQALGDLARSLCRSEKWQDISGITSIDGDGTSTVESVRSPFERWPRRERLADFLGHKAAVMLASSGCEGSCEYCGPAALQNLERREVQRAETSRKSFSCKVGGLNRRNTDDLCDEIAHLYHTKDARFFLFSDEHFLPHDEQSALDFIASVKAGLAKRRVKDFGFSAQLRAKDATGEIAEALADLGMIRAHLGVDLGLDGGSFARPSTNQGHIEAVRTMNGLGVNTISSVMIVHPFSTLESIRSALDLGKTIDPGLVEFSKMQVFEGTRLKERLEEMGILSGNPLYWDYELADKPVAEFARLYSILRSSVFGGYSITQRVHESLFMSNMARRLGLSAGLAEHISKVDRLGRDASAMNIDAYQRVLEAACRGRARESEKALVATYSAGVQLLESRLAELDQTLERKLRRELRPAGAFRYMSASILTLCMAASAPSCHKVASQEADGGTADLDSDADSDVDSDTDADSDPDIVCTEQDVHEDSVILQNAVNQEEPCFSGWVNMADYPNGVTVDENVDISSFYYAVCDPPVFPNAVLASVESAVLETDVPCPPEILSVEGGSKEQIEEVENATFQACDVDFLYQWGAQVVLLVNDDGIIDNIEVLGGEPSPQYDQILQCMLDALQGLEFPCLAGMDLCLTGSVVLE